MINPNSELARRFWEEGRLDDCPIYDFHGHMHENDGCYMAAPEPEQMLRTMQAAGVKSFIFSSHLALHSAEIREDANLPVARKFGNPFHCYHGVQSFNLDIERDIAEMEAAPDVYVGFKFLCDYYEVPLEDPRHAPYWEYLNEKKLLALLHTWGGSVYDGADNVRAVAEKYPDVTIILGHSIHSHWDKAIKLAQDFPNIYLELTAVLDDDRGILERFVREVGSDRILFGTDLPWFSTHHAIGCILSAEMTDEDRHNIFHRNGERILARFPWAKDL